MRRTISQIPRWHGLELCVCPRNASRIARYLEGTEGLIAYGRLVRYQYSTTKTSSAMIRQSLPRSRSHGLCTMAMSRTMPVGRNGRQSTLSHTACTSLRCRQTFSISVLGLATYFHFGACYSLLDRKQDKLNGAVSSPWYRLQTHHQAGCHIGCRAITLPLERAPVRQTCSHHCELAIVVVQNRQVWCVG